ncbi:MAG: SDR family oxidoreductase [Burkholderiales bacterium]|nr:SDR family oxidoreductase [Burkholderiales bacterium]
MRILVLGGDGMLGHQLLKQWRGTHAVRVTLRRDLADYAAFGLFDRAAAYDGIDVRSAEALIGVFGDFRPEVVVNAIGIVKQRSDAKEAIPSIEINALLPHRLSHLCGVLGARLIHISTDCVFSGRTGGYTEESPSDAEDLYGRTKYLGEIHGPGCLTLRTSIIGPELSRKTGLLEWFLAQRGSIRGFTNAIFSGLTTRELARVMRMLVEGFPDASGLYQVSTEPISKYDLLRLIGDRLGHPVEIVADPTFRCDRSLNSDRFRAAFAYSPPSWPELVDDLVSDLGR